MKKIILLFTFLILFQINFAYETELKLGYEPYRIFQNKKTQGMSIGFEILKDGKDKTFKYGVGSELKTGIDSIDLMAPIYFTIKQDAGTKKLFYLVGRGGGIVSSGDTSNLGLYLAGGVGKNINNFTLETLYEFGELKKNSFGVVSFKIGYKFGSNKQTEKVSKEKEENMKKEYEKQEAEILKETEKKQIIITPDKIEKQGSKLILSNKNNREIKKTNSSKKSSKKTNKKNVAPPKNNREIVEKTHISYKNNNYKKIQKKEVKTIRSIDKVVDIDVNTQVKKITQKIKEVKLSKRAKGKNHRWLWWLIIIPLIILIKKILKKR